MRVVFLDIDGVLNSVGSAVAFYDRPKPNVGRRDEDRLSPVSIGLLQRACKVTGARVVVSSTWRLGRTEQDFKDIFSRYGWNDFPYVGQTDRDGPNRGSEIQRWIDASATESDKYVILDDDSDMLPSQYDRFIHVSSVNGFQLQHYCKFVRAFGMPDEGLERHVNFKRRKEVGI